MTRSADPAPAIPSPWLPALIALGGVTLVALLGFADTWRTMASVWWGSDTFGHGLLIAPISAWLVWRQRAQLARLTPRSSRAGVAALSLACACWLVAGLAGVEVLAQFAVTATLPALVLAVLGRAVTRAIAFPLAFLFFMVPTGEALNLPLMHATADATIAGVQAIGIPVHREGLHFTLPTGRWSVVEACSGLRFVLASAVLASLFAHLKRMRARDGVPFVAVAVAIAIVANWIRAWLIVVLGHVSGMRIAVGDDHVVYGWVFYGLVMLCVFRLGLWWRDARRTDHDPAAGASAHLAPGVARTRPPGLLVGVSGAACTAILVLVSASLALPRLRDVSVRDDFADRARTALGAFTPGPVAPEPRYAGARTRLQGRLDAAADVEVYIGYFARQHEQAEMIAFGNAVVPDDGAGWRVLSQVARIAVLDGVPTPVREWRVRSGPSQRLLWSWFTVAAVHADDAHRAKALTAWSMLRGWGDHSTVSVVGTGLPGLPDTASPVEVSAALDAARTRLVGSASTVRRAVERGTAPPGTDR